MKNSELAIKDKRGINIFLLVIASSIIFSLINVFFYQIKSKFNYFELSANIFLLLTTFYLIYISQKHSTNKSGFYYYTSIGFAFVFFGLFIVTLDYVYVYKKEVVDLSVKSLYVFGYGLLAIGVTKWVKYNESRQDELKLQANTDELTGLLNRRSFTSYLKFEFLNIKRSTNLFSIVIIDIDYFKVINDEHGHLVGDEALVYLADIMRNNFRQSDKVCRWGGEEFAILLPGTSIENAVVVAEKIRKKVEQIDFTLSTKTLKMTVSAGVSESLAEDSGIDDIIKRADEALYLAKNKRNCTRSIKS